MYEARLLDISYIAKNMLSYINCWSVHLSSKSNKQEVFEIQSCKM